jgi:general secretion pathway protein J
MSPAQPPARGFTLIEVLVALALMSLLGTVLIESLRVGGHTWRHVTREAANIEEITRAQEFLRRRLGAMDPLHTASGGTLPSDSFVGESDRLEFSSTAADHSNDGRVHYWFGPSRSDPGSIEVRYHRDHTGLAPLDASDWSSEPLLAHTTGLSIQYWESPAGSSGHWVDHWADQTMLPRLIRIEVRFADSDPRRWPPLYVEPRLDTVATCAFDVVSRRCRDGV